MRQAAAISVTVRRGTWNPVDNCWQSYLGMWRRPVTAAATRC